MTTQQIEAMKLALEAMKNNKLTHLYCEDTWYSCPKHEDGCANEADGDECNCGADEINAEFDKAITAIEETLAEHAMKETQRLGQEIEQEQLISDRINYGMSVTQGGKRIDPMSIYKEPEQDGECKYCTHGCAACDARKLQKEAHDLL